MMAILGRAIGNQYVILGLVVLALFGAYKWKAHQLNAAKKEAEGVRKSLVLAQKELEAAGKINQGALDALAATKAEAQRQAAIAAAAEKKSRDRLRENNLLRKDIQNVTENPPVPAAIERVLDGMRAAVDGRGPTADRVDQNPVGGTPDPDRPEVPTETNPAPETPIG
jgi:hypothetical protein